MHGKIAEFPRRPQGIRRSLGNHRSGKPGRGKPRAGQHLQPVRRDDRLDVLDIGAAANGILAETAHQRQRVRLLSSPAQLRPQVAEVVELGPGIQDEGVGRHGIDKMVETLDENVCAIGQPGRPDAAIRRPRSLAEKRVAKPGETRLAPAGFHGGLRQGEGNGNDVDPLEKRIDLGRGAIAPRQIAQPIGIGFGNHPVDGDRQQSRPVAPQRLVDRQYGGKDDADENALAAVDVLDVAQIAGYGGESQTGQHGETARHDRAEIHAVSEVGLFDRMDRYGPASGRLGRQPILALPERQVQDRSLVGPRLETRKPHLGFGFTGGG